MLRSNVSWFIAIIVSTKSCITSFEFPKLNLKGIIPNLNSTLITKPMETLYQTPLSAVDALQKANPLKHLAPSSKPIQNVYNARSFALLDGAKHILRTKTPNRPFSVSLPYYNKQKDLANSVQNFTTRNMEVTPVSSDKENVNTADNFIRVLEELDGKFYRVSFQKLLSISPPGRGENGISFAQSVFFLYLQLIALCTEFDAQAVTEITQTLGLKTTCADQVPILRDMLSTLPKSSDFFKFHWSSRFVTGPNTRISEKFLGQTAAALQVNVDHLDQINSTAELTKTLNHMIDADSGWAMHDTFEEEELSTGVCAAWLTTMYVRARWRSAPTVLNGTSLFYDGTASPRAVRMIKINDIMRYAYFEEWDAEAIEIRYAAPELTLMILMPRGRLLNELSDKISGENLRKVYERMHTKRIAVTLPIYTLRMTLLLPGKLETMGLSRLVDSQAGANCQSLKLSHAVQRIMFWAEAGRNAFKDDGIEWDEAPELERVVDRPYIFFVRWGNITLLNGNFVL